MFIKNVRLGFACNSSSSHSLVIVPDASDIRDVDVEGEFGWGSFVCASRDAKLLYTAVQLMESLADLGYHKDVARLVAKEWAGVEDVPEDAYVDHQSQWLIPKQHEWLGYNVGVPVRSYFDDLRNYLLSRNDMAVIGGNDNGDRFMLPGCKRVELSIPTDERTEDFVARKDGDVWVLFNKRTGGKVRFSFTSDAPYTKAALPELVDLKITDQCNRNCKWCYAGSTRKGKHADKSALWRIAGALHELGVFEVALGGGEPTAHPDFEELVMSLNEYGLMVNVTTSAYGNITQTAFERLGSIAFSVQSPWDVLPFHNWVVAMKSKVGKMGFAPPKLYVNLVMGTLQRQEFEDILERCKILNITPVLLGFKRVGRGAAFEPEPYNWWLGAVRKVQGKSARVHVDTLMASQFKDELDAAGIEPTLYYTDEGKFSMFIDAVSGKMGSSSYEIDKLETISGDDGSYDAEKDRFVSEVERAIVKSFAKW